MCVCECVSAIEIQTTGLISVKFGMGILPNVIAQLVFYNQVLPPDVLTRVTLGKCVAGLVHNNKRINIAQRILNRL